MLYRSTYILLTLVCFALFTGQNNIATAEPKLTKAHRISAVGDISTLPNRLKHSFTDHGEFTPKRPPNPGEWLDQHKEQGQTFSQYLRYRANLPNNYQNTIYILPIGSFDDSHKTTLPIITEGLAAYYHPMKVKLLPPIKLQSIPAKTRIHQGLVQLHCEDTLDWMTPVLPKNAYAMLAVTMTDLYPREGWNYVFGLASLKRRVGVFSLARFERKTTPTEIENTPLKRALKLMTHETGHMFGMKHCTHFECNMGGVNHLSEADKAPLHLCPVCLRKLHHAIRFDPATRYLKLLNFYRKHQLFDQVDWIEERLNLLNQDN